MAHANSGDTDQIAPQNEASDQDLHYLLTEKSVKIYIKMENITQKPLKLKWTDPIDKRENVHSAKTG